jgi:hypothetical protein
MMRYVEMVINAPFNAIVAARGIDSIDVMHRLELLSATSVLCRVLISVSGLDYIGRSAYYGDYEV